MHEAGHIVIGRLLGRHVTRVVLTDTAHSGGHVAVAPGRALSSEQWAAFFYAGLAAQRRVDPAAGDDQGGEDLAEFRKCVQGDPAMRARVESWTEAALSAYWPAVLGLAGEIERHHGLYSSELAALGYGPPPRAASSTVGVRHILGVG